MYELCTEHQNKIERICLHPDCPARALCLLCDHPHGAAFRSIMTKQSESYRKFELTVNAAVDRYLLQRQESPEERVREEQGRLARAYFADLKRQVERFLAEAEETVIGKLTANEHENFILLRQARLDKNYVTVPPLLFKVLLQVYEGAELLELFRSKEQGNAEEAYKTMQSLHDSLTSVMEARQYRHRLKLPDIRIVSLEPRTKPMDAWTNYDAEEAPKKWEVKLGKEASCGFDSIVSDCIAVDSSILCASYDKRLRLFDRDLALRGELEYANILTKIQCIGDQVFAIALSKQILIERLRTRAGGSEGETGNGLTRQGLMRLSGHGQRIIDLHSLNTRILASCSTEGVKVWDLYRERCEYTLRQEASPVAIRFLPANNALAVGFNSHQLKIFATETMRASRKYELPGVVTVLDQGKCPESTFYAGSFPHGLALIDLRMAATAAQFALPADAPTCLVDSVNDQSALGVGDRGGGVSILDLRTRRVRVSWPGHAVKTHLSRPRGVVGLFEEGEDGWITVGCNDRAMKVWNISRAD